jgi:hypothetical protein
MIKKLASILFIFLYEFKILKRFKPAIDNNFCNFYNERITVEKIKNELTMCVSKPNSSLLIKFYNFTKKNNLKIADWGWWLRKQCDLFINAQKNKKINCI